MEIITYHCMKILGCLQSRQGIITSPGMVIFPLLISYPRRDCWCKVFFCEGVHSPDGSCRTLPMGRDLPRRRRSGCYRPSSRWGICPPAVKTEYAIPLPWTECPNPRQLLVQSLGGSAPPAAIGGVSASWGWVTPLVPAAAANFGSGGYPPPRR